jgi:hypothetical protein
MKLYFVIDTDTYSGNFERQLCAYVTGRYGECTVAKEIAKHIEYDTEHIRKYVTDEADEHGCYRPVKIYPTRNIYNNGLGFNYKIGEENLAIAEYQRSCMEQANAERQVYEDKVYAEQRAQEWIYKANNPVLNKYPAYQSVAIRLMFIPPKQIVKDMCIRAREFEKIVNAGESKTKACARYDVCRFNITGFRLVREKKVISHKILKY